MCAAGGAGGQRARAWSTALHLAWPGARQYRPAAASSCRLGGSICLVVLPVSQPTPHCPTSFPPLAPSSGLQAVQDKAKKKKKKKGEEDDALLSDAESEDSDAAGEGSFHMAAQFCCYISDRAVHEHPKAALVCVKGGGPAGAGCAMLPSTCVLSLQRGLARCMNSGTDPQSAQALLCCVASLESG